MGRSFWGALLDSKNPAAVYEPFEPTDGPNVTESLHLTQVVLGPDAKGSVSLQVTADRPDGTFDCVLCTLSPGRVDQCKVNLVFNSKVTFALVGKGNVTGKGPVHIMGCKETLGRADDGAGEDKGEEKINTSKKRALVTPPVATAQKAAQKAKRAKHDAAPVREEESSETEDDDDGARSIEDQLKAKFCRFQLLNSTGLFRNWETYKASLPVRVHSSGEVLKLHALPYWGSDEDLCTVVTQLERPGHARGGTVKYMCAPGASGKTTSIVPAFLKSKKFTHYLYLAFDNNGGRSFELAPYNPSKDVKVAEKQGAAFAVECVRILLEEPDREGPVGAEVGETVGSELVGELVGDTVGSEVVGASVGDVVGVPAVGDTEGTVVGAEDDGDTDGDIVGDSVHPTYEVPRNDDPPSTKTSQQALLGIFEKHLGKNHSVLIHVDEHREMCFRDRKGNADPGARFSRGAMQCLNAAAATVVATFTEPPPLDPNGSSGVCRCPVALPRIDIDKVMRYLELSFPVLPFKSGRTPRQLLAMLRLRVAIALDTSKALGGLHMPKTVSDVDEFVAVVTGTVPALHADMSPAALTKAIKAIPVKLPDVDDEPNDHAAALLLGMTDGTLHKKMDGESDAWARGLNDLIVLPNGKISMPVSHLVSIADASVPVFKVGGARFRGLLASEDLLSSTPLEEAYLWALACRLAVCTQVAFHQVVFNAECTGIQAGRIYLTQSRNQMINLHELEVGVLYYANEPGRGPCMYTHPLADMWFRTTNGKDVVLIDITGGNKAGVKTKKENFRTHIPRLQQAQQGHERATPTPEKAITVHGVILAPACTAESSQVDLCPGGSIVINKLMTVCNKEARNLLGGLDQIFKYMTH